jgi:hypothetical protein
MSLIFLLFGYSNGLSYLDTMMSKANSKLELNRTARNYTVQEYRSASSRKKSYYSLVKLLARIKFLNVGKGTDYKANTRKHRIARFQRYHTS